MIEKQEDSFPAVVGIYCYNHFTFEMHPYFGPHKLKKNGHLALKMGKDFWKAYEAWDSLTDKEKAATRLNPTIQTL